MGYTWQPHKRFAIEAQGGVLTEPYNRAIIGIISLFDVDETIIHLLEKSFKLGGVVSIRPQLRLGQGHAIFLTGQATILNASVSEADRYNAAFGRRVFQPLVLRNSYITAQSTLFNTGLGYSYELPIKKPNWCLTFEFSVVKTVGSINQFEGGNSIDRFAEAQGYFEDMDQELKEIYLLYSVVPSIGLYLNWRSTPH